MPALFAGTLPSPYARLFGAFLEHVQEEDGEGSPTIWTFVLLIEA